MTIVQSTPILITKAPIYSAYRSVLVSNDTRRSWLEGWGPSDCSGLDKSQSLKLPQK